MDVKKCLMFCFIFIGLSYSTLKSQTNENNMMVQTEYAINGAMMYQKNYAQFKYYIESIGTVTIDDVKFQKNELTAIYSYQQGKELRHVVSKLKLSDDGVYKGTCTTKVNGNVLFAVNTWLVFNEDGTAVGNWSWSDIPSNNDPMVKISKI